MMLVRLPLVRPGKDPPISVVLDLHVVAPFEIASYSAESSIASFVYPGTPSGVRSYTVALSLVQVGRLLWPEALWPDGDQV